MGIASDILSRDIAAVSELDGKAALCQLPNVRTVTVCKESWREDETGSIDYSVSGDIDVTTYIQPSAVDIVDVLQRVSIDSWHDTPSGATVCGSVTEYYGTKVRDYIAVPEQRAEQYTFTLSGWTPERLRVIRQAVGVRDSDYFA